MQEIYESVNSSMLELSNDPNLNLYILICAGISLSCFAIAAVFAINGKLIPSGNVASDAEPSESEHEFEYDRQFVHLESKNLEKAHSAV
jgi:hypothetical protein